MKFLFSLALKNIMRYKRRTILTFLILTFGISIYIMMTGMLKGFDDKSFENQIQFETGDFKIRSGNFDEDKPYTLSNFITNYREIEKVLRDKKYVKAFTERIQFTAELDNGIIDSPVMVVGINPDTENAVFTFTNFITEGALKPGGAVLGKSIAKDMDVGVGDYVYVTFRNRQGIYDSIELMVSGLINSPNPQVNNSTLFMDISETKKYLNSDSVSEIILKTIDYKEYLKYEPDLNKSLPGEKVYNWVKLGEEATAVGQTKSKAIGMILFFIAIIAMVGIVNTMLMSVYEKKKEIGTLKALGMTDRDIRRLFVFEGLMIGLLGSVTGVMAGILFNLYFVIVGLDITAMMGGSNVDIGYKVLGVVKSEWDVASIVRAFFVSILVSGLASYYPARKTTKMLPSECLRTVQ